MIFSELELSEPIKRAVAELGYTETTDIQEKSIPVILEGKDMIGLSQTGSGKTAAYGLPALQFIDTSLDAGCTQVLVICPTRELAMQVTDELHKFSKYIERIHVVPVYGGKPVNRQIALIRSGCQIIVGTPGRIMDMMDRHVIKFDHLKTVVLDEADEMLDMGFREDIEFILSNAPERRQTILFSATMPRAIIDIASKFLHEPEMIKIESAQMTADGIEQSFFEVARGCKPEALSLLLQYYKPKLSLVFCNTKKMVDEITAGLQERGFAAEGLHGDMRQEQRTAIMNSFKSGKFEILVATDVAARGIDVNDIDIVFNFDLPADSDYYVHRIGRTARAGKTGRSFTLIQGTKQYLDLQDIARKTKSTVTRRSLPTVEEIKNRFSDSFLDDIRTFAAGCDCSMGEQLLEKLCKSSGMDEHSIASALMQRTLDENTLKKGTVDVPAEDLVRYAHAAEDRPRRRDSRRDSRFDGRRVPNERAAKKFADVPMGTITISIGRRDKVAPKHILGAVAGESGLPGSIMGTIDIRDTKTTVEVPKEHLGRIIKSLNNKTIKGKKVSVR